MAEDHLKKSDFFGPIGERVTSWAMVERRVGFVLQIFGRSDEWQDSDSIVRTQITPRLKLLRRALDETQIGRPETLENIKVALMPCGARRPCETISFMGI